MSAGGRHRIVTEDLERICATPLPWEKLNGATVMITGAAGLVASYLVETLLYRNETVGAGTHVVAAVRNPEVVSDRFAAYDGRPDLEILRHDAGDPIVYARRIDYLVHAAGKATPSSYGRDPVGTYLPNAIGTHHLMQRAHHDGAAGVLFLSSGAVHGALPPETTNLHENVYGVVDPLDPRSSYAESKRMGETICRSWWTQYALPVRIARLGHTYGPGMRRSDERAFAQFVFSALGGNDIVLNSDGSAVRPYCYLADAIAGLFLILLRGAGGEPYLVVNPDAYCSIRELAELIASLAPSGQTVVRRADSVPPPEYLPNRDPVHPVDISKIRALGWAPNTGLRDGFLRTIESYR